MNRRARLFALFLLLATPALARVGGGQHYSGSHGSSSSGSGSSSWSGSGYRYMAIQSKNREATTPLFGS